MYVMSIISLGTACFCPPQISPALECIVNTTVKQYPDIPSLLCLLVTKKSSGPQYLNVGLGLTQTTASRISIMRFVFNGMSCS